MPPKDIILDINTIIGSITELPINEESIKEINKKLLELFNQTTNQVVDFAKMQKMTAYEIKILKISDEKKEIARALKALITLNKALKDTPTDESISACKEALLQGLTQIESQYAAIETSIEKKVMGRVADKYIPARSTAVTSKPVVLDSVVSVTDKIAAIHKVEEQSTEKPLDRRLPTSHGHLATSFVDAKKEDETLAEMTTLKVKAELVVKEQEALPESKEVPKPPPPENFLKTLVDKIIASDPVKYAGLKVEAPASTVGSDPSKQTVEIKDAASKILGTMSCDGTPPKITQKYVAGDTKMQADILIAAIKETNPAAVDGKPTDYVLKLQGGDDKQIKELVEHLASKAKEANINFKFEGIKPEIQKLYDDKVNPATLAVTTVSKNAI